MAETWSRPPSSPDAPNSRSSTTLLLRRLPAGARAKALPVLALAGEREALGQAGASGIDGTVYVLVDVGAASDDEPLAAALTSSRTPDQDIVLAALAVVPSWRGRGLGERLLAEVVDELRAPLAVVATVRQHDAGVADLEDLLGSLARERNSERLTLRGLDEADVEHYLQLVAGTLTPDPELASALHDRTDGNPFFLIELVRLLTSERTIEQLGAGDAATLDVPGSVRDTVHRRLGRLPEDTQTLLRVAAVIGRHFDLNPLAEAAAVEPDRMVALVEPALAVGLVVEDADDWSCRFSHALVRETLDASLSRLQRARIHRRVGEALERMLGPDGGRIEEHLHELAHHFFAAVPTGTADKAVDYARRAAQRTGRVLAHDEAVSHWELALSALASRWSDYQEQRYQILLGLGEARRWAGDVVGASTAVEEAVEEAVDIALHLNDPVRAARAAIVFGGVALWNLRAYGVVNASMVGLLGDPAYRHRNRPARVAGPASRDPGRRAALQRRAGPAGGNGGRGAGAGSGGWRPPAPRRGPQQRLPGPMDPRPGGPAPGPYRGDTCPGRPGPPPPD